MTFTEIERQWFVTRVPGLSRVPINDLKKQYYTSQVGTSGTLGDLEKQWLRKTITDNGGTPNGNQVSDLWTQLLASASLRVSKSTDENKMTYYLNT